LIDLIEKSPFLPNISLNLNQVKVSPGSIILASLSDLTTSEYFNLICNWSTENITKISQSPVLSQSYYRLSQKFGTENFISLLHRHLLRSPMIALSILENLTVDSRLLLHNQFDLSFWTLLLGENEECRIKCVQIILNSTDLKVFQPKILEYFSTAKSFKIKNDSFF
jgi:hypothetical protein